MNKAIIIPKNLTNNSAAVISGSVTIGGTSTTTGVATFGTTNIQTLTVSGVSTHGGETILNSALKTKQIYENCIACSGSASPFTMNYSNSAVFYLPSDYTPASNFTVNITNIPTDTTRTYVLTLLYYQPVNKVYCNSVNVTDSAGATIKNGTPLFVGGTPSLSTAPCLVSQQFSVISIATSAGVYTRYVTSTVGVSV